MKLYCRECRKKRRIVKIPTLYIAKLFESRNNAINLTCNKCGTAFGIELRKHEIVEKKCVPECLVPSKGSEKK